MSNIRSVVHSPASTTSQAYNLPLGTRGAAPVHLNSICTSNTLEYLNPFWDAYDRHTMLPVASAQLAWLNSAGHDLTVAPNPFSHAPLPQEALLLKIGSDINVHDNTKFTALHGAALNGYRNTVELLLENGAELDTKDEDRRSALFFAAIVIARAIAKQAGLKAKNGFGRTVLHAAVCVNNKEMKELSEYQFKLGTEDEDVIAKQYWG